MKIQIITARSSNSWSIYMQKLGFSVKESVLLEPLRTVYQTINDMNDLLLIIVCVILLITSITFIYLFIRQKAISNRNIHRENQWKSLAKNIPDILIRINSDMVIEYINPVSGALLRKPPITYLSKPIQLFLEQENISGIDQEELSALFESNQPVIKELSSQQGSKTLFLEFRLFPEIDENNRVKNILIIGRDISRRKLTEEKLNLAKHKAEESDQLKSAFLANMSHEIRTPLNAIVGFSSILLEENLSFAEKDKYFQYIFQNSHQLITLINDIIDISKIESGQLKIQNSEFNLNQQLREIEEIIANEKQNRDKNHLLLFLETELSDNQCDVISDPYRLRQIMINLLINAIKFTPKGFIQFGYRVLEENKLLFYVRDSGIGISKDEQNYIFQHFRQLDNTLARQYGGTGLGLAISENLVGLLGGKIWLQSEMGKGTTFYFTIHVNGLSDLKTLDNPQELNSIPEPVI